MDGAAAQRSIPQPQPCGLECPPHPRPVRSPAGPVVQEQDRLGMKSQLEGAGLGLPLQGGAWGHDPGSRQPRREAAFREGAGVGGETHTQQRREGGKKTNSRRPSRLECGLGCRFPGTVATLQAAPRPCSAFVPRGPAQVVAGHGREREAGPGVPRGPEHLGSTDQVRYRERGN